MSEKNLQILIEALREDRLIDLDDLQTTALLTWLGGSTRDNGGARLHAVLGPASEDDSLRAAAFEQLDFSLFDNDQLLLRDAGLGVDRDDKQRRHRFRLLLSVFHPDRYPARADWLTSRLQIVNRVYADFKADQPLRDDSPDSQSRPGNALRPTFRSGPQSWRGITPTWTMTDKLRARLGTDRFLAQKIIAVMLLLILLPIVSVILDPISIEIDSGPLNQEKSIGVQPDIDQMDLTVDVWPMAAMDPNWMTRQIPERIEIEHSVDTDSLNFMTRKHPAWLRKATVSWPEFQEDDIEPNVTARKEILVPVDSTPDSIGDDPSIVATSLTDQNQQLEADKSNDSKTIKADTPSGQLDHADRPMPGKGDLALGPLSNQQVGSLLSDYRERMEAGDLQGMLELLARRPRANENQGRDWFESYYDELFRSSQYRMLSLKVLSAHRNGHDWLIEADYRLDIQWVDSDEIERLDRNVRYSISPDPFQLRITSIEY